MAGLKRQSAWNRGFHEKYGMPIRTGVFVTPSRSPLWMRAAFSGLSRSIIISFNIAGSKY